MAGPNTGAAPPSDPFATQIRSVDDALTAKGVVMILYGESGVGKTTLVKTLPGDRTLLYDVDGGLDPLRGWGGKVVSAPKELTNLRQFVEYVTTATHPYSTIVIDSVSLLERRMVFAYGDSRGRDLITVQEYGDAATKLRSYLIQLRDLSAKGVNIIFICHVKTDAKGREGVKIPFLSDKLAVEIIGLSDLCGLLSRAPDGSRKLAFDGDATAIVKTRFDTVHAAECLNLSDIIARARRLAPKPKAEAAPAPPAAKPAASDTAKLAAPAAVK